MKFNELDRSQKYVDGRLYFITHQGKEILISDYSNLNGKDLEDALVRVRLFYATLEAQGKEILELLNFSNSTITSNGISELKQNAEGFNKRHMKKIAIIGITPLQMIFLRAFVAMGLADIKPFSSKEEALDWLIAD